jgi:glycosyltransferase involved in cell wall biosynthesis
VHVLYLIDSLIGGGAERSLASLAPEYARLGIQLDVAYLYERDNVCAPALRAAGAEVFSLAGGYGRVGAIGRMARLVAQRRPDLVHTTLFDADVVGRVASLANRVPIVCSLVNAAYGPEQAANPAIKPWKLRVARGIDAMSAKRVVRFHAVSTSVAVVMSRRLRIDRGRIDVIARGRDPEVLGRRTAARRTAAREQLGVGADEALVLGVGRLEYQKGFDVLIDAFATIHRAIPRARLFVAGRDGSAASALRSSIRRLELSGAVTLLGDRSDVAELLCAADVAAFPSRWEGSPGAVLEAMALEAPIVASDIPSMREVFGDTDSQTLVTVDDAGSLARAIVWTLSEEEVGTRMGLARARFLERYTIGRSASGMLEFYRRALEAAGRGRARRT